MPPKHDHIEIPKKDLWEAKRGVSIFTIGAHDASYLAYLVVTAARYARLKGSKMSPMQKAAYKAFCEKRVYRVPSSVTGIEDDEVLQAYFRLFDSLFFFGSLGTGRCELVLHEQPAELVGINGACTTREARGKMNPWKRRERVEIVLYTRGGGSNRTSHRSVRLERYISTLLHEMTHAFLNLWACDEKSCSSTHENEGVTGHGYAWQNIAAALERAARDENFLDLDVSLSREYSLASELKKSGKEMPRKELLERWDMKVKNVTTYMERKGGHVKDHMARTKR